MQPPSSCAFWHRSVAETDPEIAGAIRAEVGRQRDEIELIASENVVSRAVLDALGSPLTNKYAEGYPGRRYYGGCVHVDAAEDLAIERAKRLFGCAFANVQPHSGAQANQAAFLALVRPGDRILGMDLSAGGHLTHGARPNLSGKWFDAHSYGVSRKDGRLDYDEIAAVAEACRPALVIAGGSAVPRVIDFARFRAIADSVGAWLMVDMAHIAGLVAAGVHPSPFPHAHVVTSTTHKTLRGPRGGLILADDGDIGRRIDSGVFPGLQGGPLMHVVAAKAVAFGEALQPGFRNYAERVVANARALADTLIAGGLDVVSGGTDTHLLLADLRTKGLTGHDAETALGPRASDLQQERRALRHRPARRHLRHPAGHAGRHDAGIRRSGVPPDRRVDPPGARRGSRQGARTGIRRRRPKRASGRSPCAARFPSIPLNSKNNQEPAP